MADSFVANPEHWLEWNGVRVASADVEDSPDGYRFETVGQGWEFGSPVPVDVVMSSLLRDGDLTRTTRWGNREATFQVQVNADDGQALNLGGELLVAQQGKPGLLVWQPPDALAAFPTVFEVQTARVDWNADDLEERRLVRTFTVTLTCLPWARSLTSRTVTLTASASPRTVIDAASSTAKWTFTGPSGGYSSTGTLSTGTVGSDACIVVSTTPTGDPTDQAVWFTGAVSGTGYVDFDVALADGRTLDSYRPVRMVIYYPFSGSVAAADPIAALPGEGFTRYTFQLPSGGVKIGIAVRTDGPAASTSTPMFKIGGLYSTPGGPLTALMATPVEGSVRTPGTVEVSRSSQMRWVTIYTDPSLLSSQWSPASSDTWFRAPAGEYTVYVLRNRGLSAATNLVINGQTLNSTVTYPGTGGSGAQTWMPVGQVTLTGRRDGTVGALTITTTSGGAVDLTQVRIFRDDPDCSLLHFPDHSSTEVVIDAPSADMPFGGAWANDLTVLDTAEAWDARGAVLAAGMTAVFADADGTSTAPLTVAATYFPRWGHGAAAA